MDQQEGKSFRSAAIACTMHTQHIFCIPTYAAYKTFLGPYYFSSLVLVGIPSDSETILGNLQCNSLIMFFSSKLELHTNASTFFIECSTLAMLFKQFLSMFISFSSWHTACAFSECSISSTLLEIISICFFIPQI